MQNQWPSSVVAPALEGVSCSLALSAPNAAPISALFPGRCSCPAFSLSKHSRWRRFSHRKVVLGWDVPCSRDGEGNIDVLLSATNCGAEWIASLSQPHDLHPVFLV